MISALSTNKNKPIVIIVMGKVSSTKIGLIKVFSTASTITRISAWIKLGCVHLLK